MTKVNEIKDLIKVIRNLHGIENIEEIMNFGIGNNIYKLIDLCDKLPNDEDHRLELAEQQIQGFNHGKWNHSDITGLIIAMALTKDEFGKLKSDYELSYLDDSDLEQIEEHFNNE